jgi:uncharacterized membrane protein (UPF0127 family)
LKPLLQGSEGSHLYVEGKPEPLATLVQSAFDSASRKRGLLGRESLGSDEALVIAPCNGVHTFGMRFPIDVIYASRDGLIVKLRASMQPGRLSLAPRAFATIEMAAGTIARVGLSRGDRLVLGRS